MLGFSTLHWAWKQPGSHHSWVTTEAVWLLRPTPVTPPPGCCSVLYSLKIPATSPQGAHPYKDM